MDFSKQTKHRCDIMTHKKNKRMNNIRTACLCVKNLVRDGLKQAFVWMNNFDIRNTEATATLSSTLQSINVGYTTVLKVFPADF